MAENDVIFTPEQNVFYKVFPGGTTDPEEELLIDSSGDTFSGSKEDAIRAFFQSQSGTQCMNDFVTSAFVIFPDNDETEVEQDTEKMIKKHDRILIYRIVPNSEDEISKALIAGDPTKDLEVTLAIKEFREGFHSFMAEYSLTRTEIEIPKGSDQAHLRHYKGDCLSGESKIWPATIDFRIKPPRSKVDQGIWEMRVF